MQIKLNSCTRNRIQSPLELMPLAASVAMAGGAENNGTAAY